MRKTLLVSLSLIVCLSLVASLAMAKNATTDRSSALRPQMSTNSTTSLDSKSVDKLLRNQSGLFRAAAPGTTVLAAYTFDNMVGGCDVQGWTSTDQTAQLGDLFHVDDFGRSGLSAYAALEAQNRSGAGRRATSSLQCVAMQRCLATETAGTRPSAPRTA